MRERISLLGQTFGKLTPIEKVIKRDPKSGKAEIYYKCQCECGKVVVVNKYSLLKKKRDCGCVKKARKAEKIAKLEQERLERKRIKKLGIIGTVRGRWRVIKEDEKAENRYICECIKCGATRSILRASLKPSNTLICKSCKPKSWWQMVRNTGIYNSWQSMRARCRGTKGRRYYFDRGIKHQKSWEHFKNFYADMREGYKEGLQLDRIDTNGDYTKENCRWVTAKENCRNRRDNSMVTAGGETHALAWWIEKYNLIGSRKLKKLLQRDYGDDWNIAKGHRQNWLPIPRYHG